MKVGSFRVNLCLLNDSYLFCTLSSFCTPAQNSCNLLMATMCPVKKELISYLLWSKSSPHSMGKCSNCIPCLHCNYGNVMPFVLLPILARSTCSFPSPLSDMSSDSVLSLLENPSFSCSNGCCEGGGKMLGLLPLRSSHFLNSCQHIITCVEYFCMMNYVHLEWKESSLKSLLSREHWQASCLYQLLLLYVTYYTHVNDLQLSCLGPYGCWQHCV